MNLWLYGMQVENSHIQSTMFKIEWCHYAANRKYFCADQLLFKYVSKDMLQVGNTLVLINYIDEYVCQICNQNFDDIGFMLTDYNTAPIAFSLTHLYLSDDSTATSNIDIREVINFFAQWLLVLLLEG